MHKTLEKAVHTHMDLDAVTARADHFRLEPEDYVLTLLLDQPSVHRLLSAISDESVSWTKENADGTYKRIYGMSEVDDCELVI